MTRHTFGRAAAAAAMLYLMVGSAADAQSPLASPLTSPSSVPSPTPAAEVTLAPGAKAVAVGKGGVVFVGQQGTRADIILDAGQAAAATSALTGKAIGLVAPSDREPWIVRTIEGAQAAAAAVGATVIDCRSVNLGKAPSCDPVDGGPQSKIVGLISASPTTPTGLTKALRKGGFVAVDIASQPGGTGSVAITWSDDALGSELGRAAGSWVTAHWPGQAATVHIDDRWAYGDPTFADAIARGLAETAPDVTIVSREGAYDDANVIIVRGNPLDAALDAAVKNGEIGIVGQPLAIFGADCPEPLESGAAWTWFAGCIDYQETDAGAAAIDVIARLRTGLAVPELIEAGTAAITNP